MSDSELLRECVDFTFTWHALGDRPCRKCQLLNGRVWMDQTIWQPALLDEGGEVWDLINDRPLTHPNCHCMLEIQFTVDASRLNSYREFTRTYEEMTGVVK